MTGPVHVRIPAHGVGAAVAARVREHLGQGGLLAYPTETVYGFGGLVEPVALDRLARLKEASGRTGFLLLVPSMDSVAHLTWTDDARRLATEFWPGPLTLVLADPAGSFPEPVRSAAGAVAVRISPHPVARGVVAAVGAPITSTSANVPGAPPATTGAEALAAARAAAPDQRILVLDAGALPPALPSTIVDTTGATPRIVREGAVPAARILERLSESP